MLGYYAFQEIDPKTPAAIIEMGFISGDRSILLDQPKRAARGIVKAIECFISQK
jgi:N-acetylmuramoyl-L-alanine amidase